MGSSQTSYIAAFLFIGFFVFITIRGELPQYKTAIFGTGSGATSSPSTAAATVLGALAPLATL